MVDRKISEAFLKDEREDFEAAVAEDDREGGTCDTSPAHGLRLYEFKVLVKPDPVKEQTAGGVWLPDEHKDKLQYAVTKGTLVAMSPLAFTYEEWPEGVKLPKVGDHVVYSKYAGADVEGKDGEKYRVLADKDIIAGID